MAIEREDIYKLIETGPDEKLAELVKVIKLLQFLKKSQLRMKFKQSMKHVKNTKWEKQPPTH
ncbi:hypothetical protein [Mesobacillus maritimus]|uniref:hypothetical protein n=1 Tax=Mesobacillus maritimus TaxID=1643336 RepID=UPI00384A62F1